MTTVSQFIIIAILVSPIQWVQPHVAQDLPSEFVLQRQKCAEALGSLEIGYACRRSVRLSHAEWDQLKCIPIKSFEWGDRFEIVLDREKFYSRRTVLLGGKRVGDESGSYEWINVTCEHTFNGNLMFIGDPGDPKRNVPGHLAIDTLENIKAHNSGMAMRAAYYTGAGFFLPSTVEDFEQPLQCAILRLLKEGARVVSYRNDEQEVFVALVDANKINYEFTLDPSKDMAVVHWKSFSAGQMVEEVECRDIRNVVFGLSLPYSIQVQSWHDPYNWKKPRDEVVYTEHYTLERARKHDYSKEKFELLYSTPGSAISDGRRPGSYRDGTGRVSYTVPANPGELRRAANAAPAGP